MCDYSCICITTDGCAFLKYCKIVCTEEDWYLESHYGKVSWIFDSIFWHFQQIIVWKLIPESPPSSPAILMEHPCRNTSSCAITQIDGRNYVAFHLNRLIGHEGSIFRMAWSSDGTKLMSVSDDRRWVTCRSLIFTYICLYEVLFFLHW